MLQLSKKIHAGFEEYWNPLRTCHKTNNKGQHNYPVCSILLVQATHTSLSGNQDLLFNFKTDFSSVSAGLSLP